MIIKKNYIISVNWFKWKLKAYCVNAGVWTPTPPPLLPNSRGRKRNFFFIKKNSGPLNFMSGTALCYIILARGTQVHLRGARVYYLISFRRAWVCPWNQWVLCYLILLRGAQICLRGARIYYLIHSGWPEFIPGTVGCFVTWSCSGGPKFTSGGPGSITLSHPWWP